MRGRKRLPLPPPAEAPSPKGRASLIRKGERYMKATGIVRRVDARGIITLKFT